MVCRDTAAEAAGTGGVGTAGALAKKLSSPMSHITKENDLNVKYPSHVRVDKEIIEHLLLMPTTNVYYQRLLS